MSSPILPRTGKNRWGACLLEKVCVVDRLSVLPSGDELTFILPSGPPPSHRSWGPKCPISGPVLVVLKAGALGFTELAHLAWILASLLPTEVGGNYWLGRCYPPPGSLFGMSQDSRLKEMLANWMRDRRILAWKRPTRERNSPPWKRKSKAVTLESCLASLRFWLGDDHQTIQ